MQKWGGGGGAGRPLLGELASLEFPQSWEISKAVWFTWQCLVSGCVEQPYLIWGSSGSRNFEGRWAALGAEQMSREAGNVKVGKLHELSTHQP